MMSHADGPAKPRWPGWLALGVCTAAAALIIVGFPMALQGLCALENLCSADEAQASAAGAVLAQVGLAGVLPGMALGAVAAFTGRGRGAGVCSLLVPLVPLGLFWLHALTTTGYGAVIA
ncbi:hypothetical protein D477_013491 [Arthrobacter crystallopoietes BAB-32]|uniref:Uncharacterized protein n=1 Tax=Arthrobacter crystallopoietes BAB-32 TaxID=1246476 RepID=N1V0S9_9MICC|nr:hypothetical protein [Arthrobacter crystallopoietes]EMY33682.1 hypothetical protein D477_013491 [Arthrobacter crystallopoietes BAB-32]